MAYSDVILADSPEAYLRLGEASGTLLDETANNHDATASGSPTYGATGLLVGDADDAMTFDGTDDTLAFGSSSEFNFERTQAWTIECLIKPNAPRSVDYEQHTIFSKLENSAPYRGFELVLEFNQTASQMRPTVLIDNTFGSNAIVKGFHTDLANATTYHLVITYDGSSTAAGVKCYVNGVEITSVTNHQDTLSATIQNSVAPRIGSRLGAAGFGKFTLDELAIYTSELSSGDIAYHYVIAQGITEIISATSGDLADGSTWVGGVAPNPAGGDLIRIANGHTVTHRAADGLYILGDGDVSHFAIAPSVANGTGIFVVEDGAALTLTSSVKQGNAAWTIGEATIEYDNASNGTWQISDAHNQSASLTITGTDTNNRATVESVDTGKLSFISGDFLRGGQFRAQYVDFTGITSSGGFGWKTYLSTSGNSSYWLDCSFDACSAIVINAAIVDGTTFRVENTVWTNTVSIACLGKDISQSSITSGTRTIIGNAFDKGIGGHDGGAGAWSGFTCQKNFIGGQVPQTSVNYPFAVFEDNFIVDDDDAQMNWYTPTTASQRNYLHKHSQAGTISNAHCFGVGADMKGWIVEPGDTDTTGDVFPLPTSGTLTVGIAYNLILPNKNGEHCGIAITGFGAAGITVTVENLTFVTSADSNESGAICWGSSYGGHESMYASIKNCIAWSPNGSGYLLIRRVLRTVGDVCLAADITNNGIYNCSAGNLGFTGFADKATDGTFVDMFSTGTPNASGVYTDPEFVDNTARLTTWAVARGHTVAASYNDRVTDAWAALKADPLNEIPDLIEWVSSRWKATNTDYKLSGDGGVDLGSEGWIAAGSPINYYIQLQ